jgi:hypothetical protein
MARIVWEYRIVNLRSENYRLDPAHEAHLNRLGEDGWELAGITAINFKTGATDHIGMVFKRPRDPGTSGRDGDTPPPAGEAATGG